MLMEKDVAKQIRIVFTIIYLVGGFNPLKRICASQIGSFCHKIGVNIKKKVLNIHLVFKVVLKFLNRGDCITNPNKVLSFKITLQ